MPEKPWRLLCVSYLESLIAYMNRYTLRALEGVFPTAGFLNGGQRETGVPMIMRGVLRFSAWTRNAASGTNWRSGIGFLHRLTCQPPRFWLNLYEPWADMEGDE